MTKSFRILVFMTLAAAVILPSIEGMNPRKLDATTPTTTNPVGSLKDDIKCGSCPCGTICYTSPPPPSPPPPHKKPSPSHGKNCPPPPSGVGGGGVTIQAPPDNIYISGSPTDVYPVNQSISAARRRLTVAPELLVLSGFLCLLASFLVNFI
ncbi:hypothetical protein R6Q59_005404 [Mikania micrantha]